MSEQEPVLSMAIETAKFYGGLISGGVPANQAVQITGQYVQSLVFAKLAGGPPKREPWEDS